MSMRSGRSTVSRFCALLLFIGLAFMAPAMGADVPPEVVEAAYAVAGFRSTPKQEALVFQYNKELNMMAIRGQLPPEVYQRNQHLFDTVNKGLVHDAAKEAGLVAKTQAAKPGAGETFNPGTDTDIIMESGPSGRKITADQIEATEKAYQEKAKEYLRESGVEPPDKVNTDTDFMPHPDHTTPEEFTRINEGINQRGGTAYESPSAARVEAQMRTTPMPDLGINETGAYVSEMKKLADHKIKHADDLASEARKLKYRDPVKAKALEAEAQLLRSQASKYIDRINTVTKVVAKQNGVTPPAGRGDSLTEAGKTITKQGRGTGSKDAADVIGEYGSIKMNSKVNDYTDTLAKIAAKDPSKAAAAQQQIAEQIKDMPSREMREQAIDKARKTYEKAGGRDAEGFGEKVKNHSDRMVVEKKKPPTAPEGPTKPTAPDGPAKPGKSTTPEGTSKSAQPEGPAKPAAPEGPTKPGKPAPPEGPAKPTASEGPTKPGKPVPPEGPAKPAPPDGPGKPTKPAVAEGPTKPPKPTAPDGPTKPGTPKKVTKPATPDAPHKPGSPDVSSTRTKITNTVGTIMVLSDIGNGCDTLEKYLGGEISGEEAAETLIDQTLTLGLIGAGKKVKISANDYWETQKALYQANRQNVRSYFTQWEIQLRKAGMSAAEARRLVGQAMISGDSSALERLADSLRSEGKEIAAPKLIIETMDYGAGDYIKDVGLQTWETGKGVLVGVGTGLKYIVTAPSRIVEAWAQGELAEAELEYQSATQEAWMKAKLFQRLLKSGISPRDALKMLNDYFSGADMKKLRDTMRKLRGGYVTSQHSQQDWYCTNRPAISAPVALPPVIRAGKRP